MAYINGVRYLTIAEAAKLLGVPRVHVLAAIRDKKLTAHWHRYRLYLLPLEVERYVLEHLDRAEQRIAAQLLRAAGVRTRIVLTWKNGHGRH